MKHKTTVVFLLLLFQVTVLETIGTQSTNQNKITPSQSGCKTITCFGSANCTILPKSSMTKCVPVIQSPSTVEDVIRSNFNLTEDHLDGNSTWLNSTTNSTSHTNFSLVSAILPLTTVFM